MSEMTPYDPQNWQDMDPTTPLSGERLRYMEGGIYGAAGAALTAAGDAAIAATSAQTALVKLKRPAWRPRRMINLPGAEFVNDPENVTPALAGTYGTTWKWPLLRSAQYLLSRGWEGFRIPFLLERLQPNAFGDLNAPAIQGLRDLMDGIHAAGGVVDLDIHNYGKVRGVPWGTGSATDEYLDFLRRLVTEFKDHPAFAEIELMNEPWNLAGSLAAQATTSYNVCIQAKDIIRGTFASNGDPVLPVISEDVYIHVPVFNKSPFPSLQNPDVGAPNGLAGRGYFDRCGLSGLVTHLYFDKQGIYTSSYSTLNAASTYVANAFSVDKITREFFDYADKAIATLAATGDRMTVTEGGTPRGDRIGGPATDALADATAHAFLMERLMTERLAPAGVIVYPWAAGEAFSDLVAGVSAGNVLEIYDERNGSASLNTPIQPAAGMWERNIRGTATLVGELVGTGSTDVDAVPTRGGFVSRSTFKGDRGATGTAAAEIPGVPGAVGLHAIGQSQARTTWGTFEIPVIGGYSAAGVIVRFKNAFADANFRDAAGAATTTFKCSLKVGSTLYPFTFNGQREVTIDGSGNIPSALLNIPIPLGTAHSLVTFVKDGSTWYHTCFSYEPSGAGGYSANVDLTAKGSAAVTQSTGALFGPSEILYIPAAGVKPLGGIVFSDSVAHGTGDGGGQWQSINIANRRLSGGGWPSRLMAGKSGLINAGVPGDSVAGFRQTSGNEFRTTAQPAAGYAIDAYTRNDFSGGNGTTTGTHSAVATNRLLAAPKIAPKGQPIAVCTVTAKADSTNGFKDLAGQTETPGVNADQVLLHNIWLRAGAPINPTTKTHVPVGTSGALTIGQLGHPWAVLFDVASFTDIALPSGGLGFKPMENQRTVTDAVTTAVGSTITSATAAFASTDEGRELVHMTAGTVAKPVYMGRITKVDSATQVTVYPVTTTATTGGTLTIGDNTTSDGTHLAAFGAQRVATGLAGQADALLALVKDPAVPGSGPVTMAEVTDAGDTGRQVARQSTSQGVIDVLGLGEYVEDKIGTKVVGGTGIAVTYDDPSGVTTVTATGGGGSTATAPRPAQAIVYASTSLAATKPAATDTSTYTWVCDGTDDQAEINAAITAVRGSLGTGSVKLIGDRFNIGGPIQLRSGIHLFGEGPGTEVRAASGFNAGMVELFDATVHLTKLTDLWLNGNGQAVHGVLYNAAGGQVFTDRPSTNPDPSHTIRDLFITDVGSSTVAGHGLLMRGANLRAGKYSDMRIQRASGCGVWVDGSVDSHYTNIEIGSSGSAGVAYSASSTAPVGHGFFISQGDNNMVLNCKAYFCRGAGFYNRGTRNGYTNCQSQDNYSHGFHDTFGKSSFIGCHADSNGQANGADGRGRAGFYFAGGLFLANGCMAYDKAESSSTAWEQQWGFQLTSGATNGRITGCVTYGNGPTTAGGSTTGTATGTTVDIAAGES